MRPTLQSNHKELILDLIDVHLEKRLNEYRDYVNTNTMELKKRTDKIKELKGSFRTFFEGVSDLCPQVYDTYIHVSTMEITNLEFNFLLEDESGKKRIEMTVTLGRPGILIGKGGRTLAALEKYLSDDDYNVKILIKESNLWR